MKQHLDYLTEVSSHKITMVNEIKNLLALNVILHGVNIGQQGPSRSRFACVFQK
jgi:hypothetical protein